MGSTDGVLFKLVYPVPGIVGLLDVAEAFKLALCRDEFVVDVAVMWRYRSQSQAVHVLLGGSFLMAVDGLAANGAAEWAGSELGIEIGDDGLLVQCKVAFVERQCGRAMEVAERMLRQARNHGEVDILVASVDGR